MSAPGMPDAGAALRTAAPGADTFLRRAGKSLVSTLHGALRALKLYPGENAAVQKAIGDLVAAANAILGRDHELVVRTAAEVLFVNEARLRLELDSYAAFSHVLGVLHGCGVGTLRAAAPIEGRDWQALLAALHRPSTAPPEERLEQLREQLHLAGVGCFELHPPAEEIEGDYDEQARSSTKRLYAQSVAVARDVLQSARIGRPPSLRKLKRAVQGIVDQILGDETPLMGLTTLRDFDEYTFTHSVNVGIFAVAVGKRLGLSKAELYDLGLAAFLHDIGKTRLPLELINKRGNPTADEWEAIRRHPWLGVLVMFGMQGGGPELPLRAMRVAFEHHLRTDGGGYPSHIRSREQGLFSRIVAVADSFDAATSLRAYQAKASDPAEVLREMRENPARGLDPIVVKALVNTVGVYPIGTLVVLDTFELAVVYAAPSDPEALSRPVIRIVADAQGHPVFPGEIADLSDRAPSGDYARTIINTAEPERYGIRVSDYFI